MFILDKSFFKLLLGMAIPLTLQNLINVGVGIMDTLMLGQLGEIPLSAAALSNQLTFMFMVMNWGLAGGAGILISQYWGKQDVVAIHKVIAMMYATSVAFSLIFGMVATLMPNVFLSIFTDDVQVIAEGILYLRILGIGYIFYSITSCTLTMLRSIKNVKIATYVYLVSLFINVFFNWVFIFGNLGAPSLGVQGAAISTVIARITEFCIVIVYIIFFEKELKIGKDTFKVPEKVMRGDFIKTCTPVILNEFMWTLGTIVVTAIISRLGTDVVAANSIANVVNQFLTVFIYGLSGAASVIIGNSIGEGDYDKTKRSAATIALCVGVSGVISGIIAYNIRGFVVQFYNVEEATKQIAMMIIGINSFVIVFQTLANTINVGILRAGGDVKFVLVNDIIFMWIVAIPLGIVAAFVLNLNLIYVFIIVRLDEILKMLVGGYRLLSWKWINNVTR
ncbi:MAG: MATE family efflux transporter [Epulopiscium sp. Nele67-Bin004]|nr:MAG: MATE family efflux transporter [Epulopiscium sp. Nele67-Bin004]